jgi:molecular chaperone DnaK
MQIIPSSGLSDAEIEKMVRDAESHAAEDTRRKEVVETRNMADSAVYSAEKFLYENGDKLGESSQAAVRSQIDAVKSALGGEDAGAIRSATERLQMALQEAGAAMYEQQGEAAGDTGNGETPGQPDEDVIEGEFSDA